MNLLEQTYAKVNCSCEICTSRSLCRNVAWHLTTLQNRSLSSRLDLHLQNRVGISANQAHCQGPRQKSHRKILLNYRCSDLCLPSCELDLQLWNKSSLQDQSYLKNMDTALPRHGREIKSLGPLSIDLRSYSVANPHIDSIILLSMHNMPTCLQ